MEQEDEFPKAGNRNWDAFYEHLRQRGKVHTDSAVRRNKRYKRMATFFHISIPLTSLALTVLATSDFEYQHTVTATVAILLTVLTGANYTLEPSRRFGRYVNACIELHDILFRMEIGIEQLVEENPELVSGVSGANDNTDASRAAPSGKSSSASSIVQLLNDVNSQLSTVGREMAELPVARESQ